jgi:uncharacterized SAM-binding protein YcdF (DUF218 family)
VNTEAAADAVRDHSDEQAVPPTASSRTSARVVRRRVGRAVAALIVFGAVVYGVNLYQVWSTGRSDQARPVDAIVVMGAAQYDGRPSPQLAARLDHVVELWNRGLSEVVVVTGGKQPGDRFTEAEASSRYLTERGVPESAILQEDRGRNSYRSLEAAAAMLAARDLDTVLLVSDPFHSLRIRMIAEELGLRAYVSPTRTSPVRGATAFRRELEEAAGVMVGRVISFRRLLSITG